MTKRLWVAIGLGLGLGLAGCGGDDDDDDAPSGGPSSGATCPADNKPTYENFGRDFLATYCTSCHASALEGVARQGAPEGYDLDSLDSIRDDFEAGVLDRYAAAGPKKVNTLMPPAGPSPKPSEGERRRLGEWLACGLR